MYTNLGMSFCHGKQTITKTLRLVLCMHVYKHIHTIAHVRWVNTNHGTQEQPKESEIKSFGRENLAGAQVVIISFKLDNNAKNLSVARTTSPANKQSRMRHSHVTVTSLLTGLDTHCDCNRDLWEGVCRSSIGRQSRLTSGTKRTHKCK